MNILLMLAAIFPLIAFFTHAFIGGKELCQIRPKENVGKPSDSWIQTRAGWHWVSVDLLLSSVVLFVVLLSNVIQLKNKMLVLLSVYISSAG